MLWPEPPVRLYYCYNCDAQMHPPTQGSQPMHGRICHGCEALRTSQRIISGDDGLTFCRKYKFAMKPNVWTDICVLCYKEEQGNPSDDDTPTEPIAPESPLRFLSQWLSRLLNPLHFTNDNRPRRYSNTRQISQPTANPS